MDKIKDYEIISKIAEGGMSTVYKASHKPHNSPVAIKILSRKLTENLVPVERFTKATRIIDRLTHPNIAHVIERGISDDGHHFLVMDFVEGTDLSRMIHDGHSNVIKRMDIIAQVCKALAYAHNSEVIHRNIKPENILIDQKGKAIVSDFGMFQLLDDNLRREIGTEGGQLAPSPEDRLGDPEITYLADIYSLGILTYETLTGVRPGREIIRPSKTNHDFPKSLEKIIMKCLEKDPKNRFQSVDQVRNSILKVLKGRHIEADKKKSVFTGIKKIEDTFLLLDIIKDNEYSSLCLLKKKNNKSLVVMKKVKNQKNNLALTKKLSEITDNNIVHIYGISGDNNLFVILMEYVKGGNLQDRMPSTPSWQEALNIVKEISTGIKSAHEHGIWHGNLRPSNVLITEDNKVKLSDFTLDEHYVHTKSLSDWYRPTGEKISADTDIFSLGIISYELMVGSLPNWIGETLVSNPIFDKLPFKVRELVERMLVLNPEERYENIDFVIKNIGEIQGSFDKGEKKMERSYRLTILIALLVLLGLYYLLNNWGQLQQNITIVSTYGKDVIKRISLDGIVNGFRDIKDATMDIFRKYINR